jgi:hypothetical protein
MPELQVLRAAASIADGHPVDLGAFRGSATRCPRWSRGRCATDRQGREGAVFATIGWPRSDGHDRGHCHALSKACRRSVRASRRTVESVGTPEERSSPCASQCRPRLSRAGQRQDALRAP